MLTNFVTALTIGNCVAGVWLAAGAAFAVALNGKSVAHVRNQAKRNVAG